MCGKTTVQFPVLTDYPRRRSREGGSYQWICRLESSLSELNGPDVLLAVGLELLHKIRISAEKQTSGSRKPRNDNFATPEETGIDGKGSGAKENRSQSDRERVKAQQIAVEEIPTRCRKSGQRDPNTEHKRCGAANRSK